MQKFNLIFISLLLLVNNIIAQCIITGEVKNGNIGDSVINIRKPIGGYFNNISFESVDNILIRNNRFSVEVNCIRPVFITISTSGTYIKLIVAPTDSIHISLNYDKQNKVECTFSGSNEKGHKVFYEYNYEPTDKYQQIWKILKTSDSYNFVSDVKNEVEKQLKPFDSLFEKNHINNGYYKLMKFTITSLLSFEATRKLGDYNLTNIGIKDRNERAEVVNKLFDLYSPLDGNLYYGMFSDNYTRAYFAFQRSSKLNTNGLYSQPDTVIEYNGKKFTIDGEFAYLLLIKDQKLKEYLIGNYILAGLSVGMSEVIKDVISFFNIYYPQSIYTPIINAYDAAKLIEKSEADTKYQKYFAPSMVEIIDTIGIIKDFSFDNKKGLRDKLLFVDLWATWCAPCLQEMQYNYQIDSFLYANNISRLYISIDNPSQKDKWEMLINKIHLGGYHILAGTEMNRFLSEEFGLSEGLIAIPRYLIIQSGKILINDAYRPSEFEKLKEQIEKILGKNIRKQTHDNF